MLWMARYYGFAFALLGVIAIFVVAGLYGAIASSLPKLPDLSTYAADAPGVTTVYGQEGTILAEFATERREVVPLSLIPRPLQEAFLSAEDRRFYKHAGIDFKGLVRATVANLKSGEMQQGGSTITQQIAKAYLSTEKSFTRKLRELIFARRLETRYGKEQILALYLNHIFLGNGAFGVQAAARRYFDKDLAELDVGEMALIAGMARAPSRYSPLVDRQAAIDRRAVVLEDMVENHTLSSEEAAKWKEAPIVLRPRRDYFHEVAPYSAEHVRRELVRRLGQKGLYEGGYRVETSIVPSVEAAAQENADFLSRKLDKRQGWRGPEARLDERGATEFRRRAEKLYGAGPLEEGRLYLGLVESVNGAGAQVRVGGKIYALPVERMLWAARYSTDPINDKQIVYATEALKKLDVIWVRWAHHSSIGRFRDYVFDEKGEPQWLPEQAQVKPPRTVELELEQTPKVQSALYTYDHRSNYIVAMAGGNDFDLSEFNRVTQACRQPGSAYKPIYYSLALDRGYAYDTLWPDKPKAEIDPVTGEKWVPENIDGTYGQLVSLQRALVWSKNPPSVEIFRIVGSDDTEAWARRLGIVSPLVTSPKCKTQFCSALALGASCLHINEITDAFAVFARGGVGGKGLAIRRIVDRRGKAIEDNRVWDDPWMTAADRLGRIAVAGPVADTPAIDPRTAWLTGKLLREIVTQGHSAPIRATKIVAAGKTGTSSRTSDVWFIGYTSRWMTTAWVGDDKYDRQLGFKDASFTLSVPLWARYMAEVYGAQPMVEIPWQKPPRANDIGGPLKKGFAPPPTALPGAPGPAAPPPSRAPGSL